MEAICQRYSVIKGMLDERARRLWAAAEVTTAGRGGFTAVRRVTGMSAKTLARGLRELETRDTPGPGRVRRPGGGRKSAKALDPTLAGAVEQLVEPVTRGDPESRLRWTSKSTRKLASELRARGHQVSHTLVATLLHEAEYSLQSNSKVREGIHHPDRNAQFEHINQRVTAQIQQGQPAISVDTKKKELVGDFKNGGREWRPQGQPEEVRVHDFMDKTLGKAIPYGVYDMTRNVGWVSVGITSDTASFAVASIGRWWRRMGKSTYPQARSLLITADSGGSNCHGARQNQPLMGASKPATDFHDSIPYLGCSWQASCSAVCFPERFLAGDSVVG